jgi:hypothetical protein
LLFYWKSPKLIPDIDEDYWTGKVYCSQLNEGDDIRQIKDFYAETFIGLTP